MKKFLNYLRFCFLGDKSILPAPAETNLPSPRDSKYQKMEKNIGSIHYKRTQKK